MNWYQSMYLTDLLPYEIESKIKAGLKTGLTDYIFLLRSLQNVISDKKLGNYESFDALVGENSCQMRALIICKLIDGKNFSLISLEERTNSLINRIEGLLESSIISRLMHERITLQTVLKENDCFLLLDHDEFLMLACYLLERVKTTQNAGVFFECLIVKDKCAPNLLKHIGSVSSNFADQLVSKLRKKVAYDSVQKMREIANESKDEHLIKMLSEENSVLHNGHLLTTPMFWTYKAILHALKERSIEVFLHAKIVRFQNGIYEVTDNRWYSARVSVCDNTGNKAFKLERIQEEQEEGRCCFVVRGSAHIEMAYSSIEEWEQNLLSYSLDTIILAGAAEHRQYPSDEESDNLVTRLQDHEHETYTALAREEGFSLENPSTFFIQHVFAANSSIAKASHSEVSQGMKHVV